MVSSTRQQSPSLSGFPYSSKKENLTIKSSEYCQIMQESLTKSDYQHFEKTAGSLAVLLQANFSTIIISERIENPMSIVTDLISLVRNPKLEQASLPVKLSLARVLHTSLDLMLVDNYERKPLEKININKDTKEKFLKAVGSFQALNSVELRYELDCCIENIKALDDRYPLLDDLKNIFNRVFRQDIQGLTSLSIDFHNRSAASWQPNVLLIRRLTPLAQFEPNVLTMLQEVMASLREAKNFQPAYASQEALYQVIIGSRGAHRNAIIIQAFGFQKKREEELKALSMQYFAGFLSNPKSWIYKTENADARYRFIKAVEELLFFDDGENTGQLIRANTLKILLFLSSHEPLPASRQQLAFILQKIIDPIHRLLPKLQSEKEKLQYHCDELQKEIAKLKKNSINHIHLVLPMYTWTKDEKSEDVLFYKTIAPGPLANTQVIKYLNTIFSILKYNHPEISVPDVKSGQEEIRLYGFTEKMFYQLNLYKKEIAMLHQALMQYRCEKVFLKKPGQAFKIVRDLQVLSAFDTEKDHLSSLKMKSAIGAVAAKCLVELNKKPFLFFSFNMLNEENKQAIIKNISSVYDILPALHYLTEHSLTEFWLFQDIFDLIIKKPESAMDYAKCYVWHHEWHDGSWLKDTQFLFLFPQMAKVATIHIFLYNKDAIKEAFNNPIFVKFAEIAAEIFYHLHYCGRFFSLLHRKNIDFLVEHAEVIPVLYPAIKYLNERNSLTQSNLDELFKDPINALFIADKIISNKSAICFGKNPHCFTKQLAKLNEVKTNDNNQHLRIFSFR